MSDQLFFQPLGDAWPTTGATERASDIDPRLTRTHYFDGRLLTADDLNRDLLYLDQRLREVGQTLGSGVVRGLELSLDDTTGELVVQAGVGVSAAGRVLELQRSQKVNLGARATISRLNKGRYRRLERGLYAVVLRYAEVRRDIAEVFPRDLGEKRGFQYDVIAESVQLGLAALPQPLPQQHQLGIRANLIREYLGDGMAAGVVPEDAVALGVLAIRNDRPEWLDSQLLRRPLRSARAAGDLQADLERHYRALFEDVMAYRHAGSLGGDFAADEYFRLLPPAGPMPKESVDPVTGRQGFFPEGYRVWVAPIRGADLPLVKQESMRLPPLDLTRDEPVDVIVLAPLSNQDYGYFARRLERAFDPATRRLPFMDLLRLRLYPRAPVHALDTDEGTWRELWDRVSEASLLYIRRPTRAAETAISGIVLAQGTALPSPSESGGTGAEPPDAGGLIQDEDQVFLNRIDFSWLRALRPPLDDEGAEAWELINGQLRDDADAVQSTLGLLLLVGRGYDALIWQTLVPLLQARELPAVNERLSDLLAAGTATGQAVVDAAGTLLAQELGERWLELDQTSEP
jgi:hypothetical protein